MDIAIFVLEQETLQHFSRTR